MSYSQHSHYPNRAADCTTWHNCIQLTIIKMQKKTYFRTKIIKKGSPYSITKRRVPKLIPVLGSQPTGDMSHKPGGRLPLLSARPAVTPATLKRAATNFAAWWTEAQWVRTVCLRLLPDSVATVIWTGPSVTESSTLTTRLPSHPKNIIRKVKCTNKLLRAAKQVCGDALGFNSGRMCMQEHPLNRVWTVTSSLCSPEGKAPCM